MAELQLLTSLRVESQAVGGADVVVGMGHRRARRTAATLGTRLADSSAIAMVGVAGGLGRGLSAGDLVVATEVRHADGLTDGNAPCQIPCQVYDAHDLSRHVGLIRRYASRPAVPAT